MKKNLALSYFVLISLLLSSLSPLSAQAAYNQSTAKTYLQNHANNSWSVLGLAALGQTPSVDFLKNFSGTNAIDYAAPILALTAVGRDPKTFPDTDLVSKLKSFYAQGQLGDTGTVNDDIFGSLALLSSGEDKDGQILKSVKNFILQNQNQDGGWGFAISAGSDSNTTASAIVALSALGIQADDSKIVSAIAYLKTAQNTDGGFTYDPQSKYGTASDSSSTAWVMWAINALNAGQESWSKEGHTPSEYLASTQSQDGYFEWQTGAGENSFSAANTAYAAIALEGKTLPLLPSPQGGGIEGGDKQFAFRLEGSQDTICEGAAAGPSALDVVKNASGLCGFTYHIKDTSFGPYLDKINNDEAAGSKGWQYWVHSGANYTSPSVGAADYSLKNGEEVLWAFGNFDIKPTSLTLDAQEISSGQSSQAKVEYFDGQAKALEGAKIFVGTANFTSGNDGKAAILAADGYYKVFAEKDGFVRSNKVLLKVGQPGSADVNLSVNVSGKVAGTSTPPTGISFTIEPANLDFGTLAPGATGKKTFALKNTGSQSLEFEAEVSGQLFRDNLKLNSQPWQKYKKIVDAGQSQSTEAALTLPGNAPSGKQNGKLIFWAKAK